MARLLYDTQTQALLPYPRQDDQPVVGLDPRYLVMTLIQEPQPEHDSATERLEPTEVIDIDVRTVERGWAVIPLAPPTPPEPPADWLGFAGWLYGFSPMMDAMNAARASHDPQGEPATTGLPAALQEARAGNTIAFALSWAQFLAASSMDAADLAEIVGKASLCRLPPEFISALQPATP